MQDDLHEKLAALAHEQWSGWMRYLFEQCEETVEGDGIHMPRACVERWARQVNTPYTDLSEEEKESDRKEADRVLEILIAPAPVRFTIETPDLEGFKRSQKQLVAQMAQATDAARRRGDR